jgi:hypothetical protein
MSLDMWFQKIYLTNYSRGMPIQYSPLTSTFSTEINQPTTLQTSRLRLLPSASWLQVLFCLNGQALGFRNPEVYFTNSWTDPLRIFVNINYNN